MKNTKENLKRSRRMKTDYLNQNEKELLNEILKHTLDSLDMSDSMEYGTTIRDILTKLETK